MQPVQELAITRSGSIDSTCWVWSAFHLKDKNDLIQRVNALVVAEVLVKPRCVRLDLLLRIWVILWGEAVLRLKVWVVILLLFTSWLHQARIGSRSEERLTAQSRYRVLQSSTGRRLHLRCFRLLWKYQHVVLKCYFPQVSAQLAGGPHTWLTPWMIVLGLELAVVLELERSGCPSEGSQVPSSLEGPSHPWSTSLKSWNSTSLASPSAAWVGGSKPKTAGWNVRRI